MATITPVARTSPLPTPVPRPARVALATAVAGILYFALHLPYLAWASDDIDATNFMLAVRDFDLREHQPHPPGYPVFIAMGRVARVAVASIGGITGSGSPETVDINALAICSALFGALAVFPLVGLWTTIGADRSRAWLAAVLALSSPVVWYTGIRPLSDLPGLAVAVASVALLMSIVLRSPDSHTTRRLVGGAVLAGAALGIRTQTLWLTAPALVLAAAAMLWRRDVRALAKLGVGFLAGVLVWAVPLLIALDGWRSYIDVVSSQAADDFRGAILAVVFSPRGLATGLYQTFVLPWGTIPVATIVLMLAAVGGLALVIQRTREALLIAALFGPYLTLHLLFHDTTHTRYAIPLVPVVAYLAAYGLRLATTWQLAAGLALVLAAVWTSIGPVITQARVGSPATSAVRDVREALSVTREEPVIAMHHAVQRQLRFAEFDRPLLAAPARYEWLAVVDYFRSGGEAPVWFLASRRRSDLVLFDPAAKRIVQEYDWSFAPETVLGGIRPKAITWHEITRPGWMAGEGWALTPETRGVANRSQRSASTGTTVAYIARRNDAAVLMIGGRNLGGPCLTAARLQATLDGRPIAEWQVPAGEAFVYFVDLPDGALAGRRGYAELRLRASDLSGAGLGVDVALEQFDVQSGRRPVAAFAQGWHEPELEAATGARWRWAGQRAVIQVRNFGRDVVLHLRADDPTRTLGRAVELRVRGAGRVLAERHFVEPVEWDVRIPADVIEQARGRLTLTSDGSFVPDQTEGNGDRRELALRVFDLDVEFDTGDTIARQ